MVNVGRLCITSMCALVCFATITTLPRYAQASTTPLYSTIVTTTVVYLMTGAFMSLLVLTIYLDWQNISAITITD